MSDKPREFWLWKTWSMPWTVHTEKPSPTKIPELDKQFHVIEKSYVEKLEAEVEKLKKESSFFERASKGWLERAEKEHNKAAKLDRENYKLRAGLKARDERIEGLIRGLKFYAAAENVYQDAFGISENGLTEGKHHPFGYTAEKTLAADDAKKNESLTEGGK